MKRYDSPDDVAMRLHKTIVRFKGTPVMVFHDGGYSLEGVDLLTDIRLHLDANDDENLDISSPPIGYVNNEKLYYLSRAAYRHQRQGLYMNDVMIHNEPQRLGNGWTNREFIQNKPLGECIVGKYPTPKEVAAKIQSGTWQGGAFHRKMGLVGVPNSRVLELRYVCENFGFYLPKDNVILVTAENQVRNHTAMNILADFDIPVEIVKTPEG